MKRWIKPVAITALLAGILKAMGQPWWCKCGQPFLWSNDTWGTHNSQHLADAYTGSHIQHGFLFYLLFWKLRPQDSYMRRLTWAMLLESAWEIWENTPFIINRYRQDTISLDYVGDSVANSVADLWSCVLGYIGAGSLPLAASLLIYVGIEATMLVTIRDSLTLNVWMLVAPNDTVKNWQHALKH